MKFQRENKGLAEPACNKIPEGMSIKRGRTGEE